MRGRATPAATATTGSSTSGNFNDAIAVLDPGTPRELDVQRIPVQVNDTQIAYLKDAMWVERPARLFRSLLAETLRLPDWARYLSPLYAAGRVPIDDPHHSALVLLTGLTIAMVAAAVLRFRARDLLAG